jgi:hypothetical protein
VLRFGFASHFDNRVGNRPVLDALNSTSKTPLKLDRVVVEPCEWETAAGNFRKDSRKVLVPRPTPGILQKTGVVPWSHPHPGAGPLIGVAGVEAAGGGAAIDLPVPLSGHLLYHRIPWSPLPLPGNPCYTWVSLSGAAWTSISFCLPGGPSQFPVAPNECQKAPSSLAPRGFLLFQCSRYAVVQPVTPLLHQAIQPK